MSKEITIAYFGRIREFKSHITYGINMVNINDRNQIFGRFFDGIIINSYGSDDNYVKESMKLLQQRQPELFTKNKHCLSFRKRLKFCWKFLFHYK